MAATSSLCWLLSEGAAQPSGWLFWSSSSTAHTTNFAPIPVNLSASDGFHKLSAISNHPKWFKKGDFRLNCFKTFRFLCHLTQIKAIEELGTAASRRPRAVETFGSKEWGLPARGP